MKFVGNFPNLLGILSEVTQTQKDKYVCTHLEADISHAV